MKAFDYGEISEDRDRSGKLYLQFVNEGTLSLGLYVLPAGSVDTQTPHAEDEIYYVVTGRGVIDVAGERRSVQPGSIVFVAKAVDHRFVDILEDLSILVFFAPEHQARSCRNAAPSIDVVVRESLDMVGATRTLAT